MKVGNVNIRLIENENELDAVCRFRYKVYVEEMGKVNHYQYADHVNKIIKEPLDTKSYNLSAWLDNNIVGAVRLNLGRESELGFYEDFYQMTSVGGCHPEFTCIVTRLMIDVSVRNTELSMRLMLACYETAIKSKIKYAFMNCDDHLIKLFRRFGWQDYIGKVKHPEHGAFTTPLRLDMFDLEHLKKTRSPFLTLLTSYLQEQRCINEHDLSVSS